MLFERLVFGERPWLVCAIFSFARQLHFLAYAATSAVAYACAKFLESRKTDGRYSHLRHSAVWKPADFSRHSKL